MLEHLLIRGETLDFADTKALITKRDNKWNVSKNPQLYFNRVEKAIKGLDRNGINSDLNEQRDIALYYLKAAVKFDAACCEWEQKTSSGQDMEKPFKLSFEGNMLKKTNKTNVPQNTSKQM
jgi:hypothetical protein